MELILFSVPSTHITLDYDIVNGINYVPYIEILDFIHIFRD